MPLSHRSRPGQSRDQRRDAARNAAAVRRCCSTRFGEAHATTCPPRPSWCADKIGYADRAYAKHVVRELRAVFGTISEYRCNHCGLHHIGHPQPGQRRHDEGTW